MSSDTQARIDDMGARIDRLEAKGHESTKGQAAALRRQEASARTAMRENADGADREVRQLPVRIAAAEYADAAEAAEERDAFAAVTRDYADAIDELADSFQDDVRGLRGAARKRADAAIADVRHSAEKLGEHVSELRGTAGDRRREKKNGRRGRARGGRAQGRGRVEAVRLIGFGSRRHRTADM